MHFSQVCSSQFLGCVNDMVLLRNTIYIYMLFSENDLNINNIISGIQIIDKLKKVVLR